MPLDYSERAERRARLALIVAMVVSAAFVLLVGAHFFFWADELDWLNIGTDFAPRTLLTPHGSHLIALPRVIYEAVPRLFGSDYLPFRLIGEAVLLSCVGLFFVLLRRRVGGVIAVFPAIVMLFFGAGQEIVLSPLGIPFTLSIALGLAALLAVERSDLRGDLLASLLLILAALSHTFGVIVAMGVLIFYALERKRRRELWVAAIPLLFWVVWWFWARQFDQSITSDSNILGAPWFVLRSAGAAIEAASGVGPGFGGRFDVLAAIARVVFDLIAVLAIGLLAWRVSRGGSRPWLFAYLGMALFFWLGLALAASETRETDTPRYLFFGVIMVFLIAGEALRGVEVPKRAVPYLLVLFAVSLVGNAARLPYGVRDINDRTAIARAQITVQELESASLDPGLVARYLGPPASDLLDVPVAQLVALSEEIGQLGFTLDELRDQSEDVRVGADYVLIRGLGLSAVEIPKRALREADECRMYGAGDDGFTTFPLSPGANFIELVGDSGVPGATLSMGRFADTAGVPVGALTEGNAVSVLLPDDAAPDPWFATTTGRIRACTAS